MKLALILLLGLHPPGTDQDTVTLENCLDSTLEKHPSTATAELAQKLATKKKEVAATRYRPELSLRGNASYQSEVVELPGENRMLSIPELPHERFKVYGELTQTIYDGGATRVKKHSAELQAEAKASEVEETHHALKEQVLQLYFSRILADESREVIDTTIALLEARHSSLKAAQEKGVVTGEDLLRIRTRIQELKKKREKLSSKARRSIRMLNVLTRLELDTSTHFQDPSMKAVKGVPDLHRPELHSLSLKQEQLSQEQALVDAQKRPKASFFAQGGGGRPNPYNFFDDEFSSYYLLGVRFSWSIWNWGRRERQKESIELQKRMVEQQKEGFRRKVCTEAKKHEERIRELSKAIERDERILEMRMELRKSSASKLEKGAITATEHLRSVSDEARVRLELLKQQTRKELAKTRLQHLLGNL